MDNQFIRTEMLVGTQALNKLKTSRVAVFGIGGVGSYAAEALARSGIGSIDIIDNDTIDISNLNRQLYALHSTIGQYKVDVAEKRIRDINPEITIRTFKTFFLPENAHLFHFHDYDYIIDAVDTVTAKIELAVRAHESGVPIISSMGTGNKLNPALFCVSDLYKTSVCPLAKVMRRELKTRGIKKLKVVYSVEEPIKVEKNIIGQKRIPGSTAFVPATAGMILASEVMKDLIR